MNVWPELPAGWTAQPAVIRQFDGTTYELVRVYDPRGRLDTAKTHWLVTHAHGEMPHPKALSFGDLGATLGKHAVSWRAFTRLTFERSEVDAWFNRVHEAELRRRRPRHGSRIDISQPASVRV